MANYKVNAFFCFSITAEMYNCFVTHVGADCGKMTVAFLITTYRTMEPSYCTRIIDRQYKEPVSAGTQLTRSIIQIGLSFFLALVMI